jgi:hypothetical protein
LPGAAPAGSSANGPLLAAASLRLDDVYYSLEYDAEDWEKHADNPWLQHQVRPG